MYYRAFLGIYTYKNNNIVIILNYFVYILIIINYFSKTLETNTVIWSLRQPSLYVHKSSFANALFNMQTLS